jgi:uronate dehydrogenase
VNARPPILLTGAAGLLGNDLRPRLLAKYGSLRSTDRTEVAPLPHEEFVACDLGDPTKLATTVDGCRTVLHFGGVAHHADFPEILQGNIVGAYNLFEAARQAGVSRIVFASTGHVVGFHPKAGKLDANAPHRPDSLYGLSKCFGEDLARLYWDKHGIECAALRIGICGHGTAVGAFAPIWLSNDDLWRMIEACLDAPLVGFTVLYGASDNRHLPWHNGLAAHIPYAPKDGLDRAHYPTDEAVKKMQGDPAAIFIGGPLCAAEYRNPTKGGG